MYTYRIHSIQGILSNVYSYVVVHFCQGKGGSRLRASALPRPQRGCNRRRRRRNWSRSPCGSGRSPAARVHAAGALTTSGLESYLGKSNLPWRPPRSLAITTCHRDVRDARSRHAGCVRGSLGGGADAPVAPICASLGLWLYVARAGDARGQARRAGAQQPARRCGRRSAAGSPESGCSALLPQCEGANVQLTCSSRTSVSHLPETLQIITGPPPEGPKEGQYDNLVVDGRRLEPADG
jgi:hypothetical protein